MRYGFVFLFIFLNFPVSKLWAHYEYLTAQSPDSNPTRWVVAQVEVSDDINRKMIGAKTLFEFEEKDGYFSPVIVERAGKLPLFFALEVSRGNIRSGRTQGTLVRYDAETQQKQIYSSTFFENISIGPSGHLLATASGGGIFLVDIMTGSEKTVAVQGNLERKANKLDYMPKVYWVKDNFFAASFTDHSTYPTEFEVVVFDISKPHGQQVISRVHSGLSALTRGYRFKLEDFHVDIASDSIWTLSLSDKFPFKTICIQSWSLSSAKENIGKYFIVDERPGYESTQILSLQDNTVGNKTLYTTINGHRMGFTRSSMGLNYAVSGNDFYSSMNLVANGLILSNPISKYSRTFRHDARNNHWFWPSDDKPAFQLVEQDLGRATPVKALEDSSKIEKEAQAVLDELERIEREVVVYHGIRARLFRNDGTIDITKIRDWLSELKTARLLTEKIEKGLLSWINAASADENLRNELYELGFVPTGDGLLQVRSDYPAPVDNPKKFYEILARAKAGSCDSALNNPNFVAAHH